MTRKNLLHNAFRASLIFKGIDGILEMIGGVLLLLVAPATINRIVLSLTQHELSEDPKDVIANYLLESARHLTVSAKLFGSFYLLSHGVIKILLVASLWRGKLWSYPVASVFFIVFILYQLYRFSHSHSVWMIILSGLDALLVLLTWIEYKSLRGRARA